MPFIQYYVSLAYTILKIREEKKMNTCVIEFNNEKHTTEEWAKIYGIDEEQLVKRLRCTSFSLKHALNFKEKKRERLITYNGKTQNLSDWAKELDLPYFCLRSRLNTLKWTVEKAFTTPYKKGDKNGN